MGGCAKRGPTCISQGNVDIDAGTLSRQQTPTPGLVRVDNTVSSAKLQDIYIKIFGYDRPGEAGTKTKEMQEGSVNAERVVNTADYLSRRKPLETIWIIGGEGKKNPSDQIVQQVKLIESKKGPLGSIIILGGSAGGKNALEVAGKLTALGMGVRYVGIADGAFQKADILIEHPLTFKAPEIRCMEKVNWYQSWGHTLDPKQELHGKVEDGYRFPFANIDLTHLTDQTKMSLRHNLIDEQEAIEEAHVKAYLEAFKQAAKRILEILRSN